MPNNYIDKIQVSGVTYDIGGGGGIPESAFTAYTASTDIRISQDEEVTAAALNELNEAVSGKQDTLSAGTNITIVDNVISAEGGGKAIEAGRGISITTGETADTVSFDLPISAGTGSNSIAEGGNTTASGDYSHAEGYFTQASSYYSHAEGYGTTATTGAHAEGQLTKASGDTSHAEGYGTIAKGIYSHAEGQGTSASGSSSHAEGNRTTASGNYGSHAEGYRTTASGSYSHAEGNNTSATSYSSHAEGLGTTASGESSHAEGDSTKAGGYASHAEGSHTETNNYAEHASGYYNVSSSGSAALGHSGNTLFSVGNGASSSSRHNAFEIRQNGDIYLSSGGTDIKLQDHLGGGGTVDQTIISGSTNAVAGGAVYNKIDEVEQVTAAGLNALNDKITPTVELTQAEYDALVTAGTVAQDTYYIITDAQAGDLTQYWTSAQTQSAINQATSGKQETLVSGTNIKTINNTSILGSGNIDIQGGGKAIEAGRGISITTGATADTVSFDLPISATTDGSILIGVSCSANREKSFVGGQGSAGQGEGSFAFGQYCKAGQWSIAVGNGVEANISPNSAAFGKYNKQNGGFFEADSATTLFSVGNGTSASERHNAFEIRRNGDIYLTKDGQDVKLQDQLGGSSITVDTALDSGSTNPVENRVIYNKIDEVEQVTAAGLNAVNDKFDGLKLKKLTQAEYDALSGSTDANTLYVIVN
ncbi:MAG: hypothetical protein IKE95_09720 [Methanobrevibacter sp.]|nr:hypothetical protein [Methanobrevibacter sp.]